MSMSLASADRPNGSVEDKEMIFGGKDGYSNNGSQENIVLMDRFRSRTSVSPLRQAEAYWTALRKGDDIPSRSQIDPRGLENILSQTFILERVAPGIARFRLAGQKVNELAGMEVRGMPLTAFFTAEARKTVSAALENMFDEPSIVAKDIQSGKIVAIKSEATRIRGSREGRIILLPLRSDLGDVSRALGVFVAEGSASRMAQRFSVVSCTTRSVTKGGKPIAKKTPPAAAGTEPSKPIYKPTAATKTKAAVEGFKEARPAFEHKSGSLMNEARALLDRARRENNDAMRAATTAPSDHAARKTPDLKPLSTNEAEGLVSRKPRAAKTKAKASHLRLVVSRD